MPKTKLENFVFTVIMAFIMVYAMICYNISLNIGGMQQIAERNATAVVFSFQCILFLPTMDLL